MIKQQIKDNASRIWEFLDETQVTSVFEIEEILLMQKQDVLIALGWLAHQNKVYFFGDKNDCKIMIIY